MRAEDSVNVHRTAFKQQGRSNGANITLPETLLPSTPWWERITQRWFHWEHNLTVAGRTIEKGWVVPQGLGIALIVVMLGGVGSLYWRMTDKVGDQAKATQDVREMLIRLDQRLLDKNEHDNQRFDVIQRELQDHKESEAAWQQVTNKEIAQIKAKKG